MTNGAAFDQPVRYQIRVKGSLDRAWSEWFDGFDLIPQADEETILAGLVADQAALHGLLVKIRNLGLPLISVQREMEEKTCKRSEA
jgi:hypothetical protein